MVNQNQLSQPKSMTNSINGQSIQTVRKHYTPEFKFNRAIEAIKKNNLSEISRQYGIAVNILSRWKDELLTKGSHIFENDPGKEAENQKKKIAKLEQMIGKKEVELNLLKNFSDFYQSQNTP